MATGQKTAVVARSSKIYLSTLRACRRTTLPPVLWFMPARS